MNVQGDIPIDLPQGSFISVHREPALKLYSIGFQPAKSIPEIPRWFLSKYGTRSFTVLEPFAGSGTTIIEALKYGASIYWLDYHPLSRLICRVKTMQVEPEEVRRETSRIISNGLKREGVPQTIAFANKDFWFQKPVQDALEVIRCEIRNAEQSTQSLLWLAFASTVRKTSDMNDSMILAAKRSQIADTPHYSRGDVFHYFESYVQKILDALIERDHSLKDALKNSKELLIPDARNLFGEWQCDAVITSPPYINAIDYVWASKFELHWLGYVQDDHDRLCLYEKEIGTERIAKHAYEKLGRTGVDSLDQLIEDVFTGKIYKATPGQNALRARVVYQYFVDMQAHFKSSARHVRSGGYYCFSIGEKSRICGVEIPVAEIMAGLAGRAGFQPIFQFHVLLKNRRLNVPRNVGWAGTIKHDTVIVLQKAT